MKTYRIVYWFNSITTERYIKARSEEEAREKMGDWVIVSIEEVKK